MVDVVVRPRTIGDLPAVVDALTLVARSDGYPSRWPEDPVSWLRTSDLHGAWVADRRGEMLGHIILRRALSQVPVRMWCSASGEDPASCAVISRLFVVPHARCLGIGRSLVEAAWTAASDMELRPVLDVVDANQDAIRLYRRLGWTHVGAYEERFTHEGTVELLHCFAAPRSRADRDRPTP